MAHTFWALPEARVREGVKHDEIVPDTVTTERGREALTPVDFE